MYFLLDITDTIHNPNSRPVSQLSCISEDLQTIPSVEVHTYTHVHVHKHL